MGKAIIGEKLGMTQLFKGDLLLPVTVIAGRAVRGHAAQVHR